MRPGSRINEWAHVIALLAAVLFCFLSRGNAAVKSIIDYYPDMVPAGGWVVKTNVGLPGGYPNTSGWTVVSPTVDVTGATDSSVNILAAISAAGTGGTIIQLPATTGGQFLLINFQLTFQNKKNILLRSAGAVTTMHTGATARAINVTGGSRANSGSISSGLTKGSTSITLQAGLGASYAAGDIIQVAVANDPAIPVISVFGFTNMRTQVTRVTNVATDTLTIFPALYDNYTIGASVSRYAAKNEFIGFENLTIDMSNSNQNGVEFALGAYACWLKNVQVLHSANRNYVITDALQCQIARCRADFTDVYPSANGAGVLVEGASGCLFEDSIIYEGFPGFEVNSGCAGNVFAYCFLDRNGGKGIDTNHNSHNFMNLYEGCAVGTVQTDGYYGSVSKDSFWRNYIRGLDDGTPVAVFVPNRMTRDYGLFGNVMGSAPSGVGNPNLGNGSYTGSAASDNWKDYGIAQAGLTGTLTTRTSNTVATITFSAPSGGVGGIGQLSDGTNGDLTYQSQGARVVWSGGERRNVQVTANTGVNVGSRTVQFEDWPGITTGDVWPATSTAMTVWTGNAGFQELDLRAGTTLRLKGNYYSDQGQIPSDQIITPDTLAASVAYASETNGRPDWWDIGSFSFPPYDAASPSPSNDNIPAGRRFLVDTPPQEVSALVSTSGTNIVLTFNKTLSFGAGGANGFTITATLGAATVTYASTIGASINLTVNRTISDEEVVTISYVQPGNGWEDSNGNDLPSFSSMSVQNNSGQTTGAEYQYTTLPDNAIVPEPYDLSNDVDSIYPMVYSKSGSVTKLAVQIGTSTQNGIGVKIAIYDAALNLMSSGTGSFNIDTATRFVSVDLSPAVSVTAGATYYVMYKFNSDDTPQVMLQTGLASGASFYRFGPVYGSWPAATITLQFTDGTTMASVRSRLVPSGTSGSGGTVAGMTTATQLTVP